MPVNPAESVIPMNETMKKWIKAAGVRALKTIAQTAVATIGTAAVLATVDWRVVLSASVLAGILSLLTSVAGLPEVDSAQAATPLSAPVIGTVDASPDAVDSKSTGAAQAAEVKQDTAESSKQA